jgi:hypothetical protein
LQVVEGDLPQPTGALEKELRLHGWRLPDIWVNGFLLVPSARAPRLFYPKTTLVNKSGCVLTIVQPTAHPGIE